MIVTSPIDLEYYAHVLTDYTLYTLNLLMHKVQRNEIVSISMHTKLEPKQKLFKKQFN